MPAIACHCWLLLLCLVIYSIDTGDAIRSTTWSPPPPITHSSFLRTAVHGGRHQHLSCSNDPAVCFDREKNPWGGTTCCFDKFCKDTMNDRNHCGGCGRRCVHGLLCCGGRCIDVRTDPDHCGSCYNVCPQRLSCSFGMCNYGGGDL